MPKIAIDVAKLIGFKVGLPMPKIGGKHDPIWPPVTKGGGDISD